MMKASEPSLQILASFTNGSLAQLPNPRQSTAKEINRRIQHAIQVRSGDRMHQEHIAPSTLVFKDTHIESKVRPELLHRDRGIPLLLTVM